MRRMIAFQPGVVDALETRQLLSHVGIKGHAVMRPAAQHAPKAPAVTPVVAINAAFDSFVQDYSQTRAIYLSSITPPPTSATAPAATPADPTGSATNLAAFSNYTTYRVQLLGQQVTSVLIQANSKAVGSHGNRSLFNDYNSIVQSRISGFMKMDKTMTAPAFRVGTLGASLIATIPATNSTPAGAALSSLAQDQAIIATRIAVINGFNYSNSTFRSNHK